MDIGGMRQRVAVDRPCLAPTSGKGGVALGWEEVQVRWAKVEQLGGTETTYANQQAPEHSHRVQLRCDRFTRSMPETYRLRWINTDPERELSIVAVIPDQRNRFVIVLCTEHPEPTDE